jgi:hypothetical protein
MENDIIGTPKWEKRPGRVENDQTSDGDSSSPDGAKTPIEPVQPTSKPDIIVRYSVATATKIN